MILIHSLQETVFPKDLKTCVCIGMFDGVHLGHQKLIQETVKVAKELNQPSLVLTFQTNPKITQNATHPLTSLPEKLAIIEELGIDYLINLPFPGLIAELKPSDFVSSILIKALQSSHVFVGKNFHFGYKRSGNCDDLVNLGHERNLSIHIQNMQTIEGKEISSTFCRYLIDSRMMEKATLMLGYPYFITGKVTKGHGRGKILGMPTINLKEFYPEKIKPGNGVFITKTCIKGVIYSSLTLLGPVPSFDQPDISIETLILDFNESIYEEEVTVFFFSYLRDIVKFKTPEELTHQIQLDKLATISYYSEQTTHTQPDRFQIPPVLSFLRRK